MYDSNLHTKNVVHNNMYHKVYDKHKNKTYFRIYFICFVKILLNFQAIRRHWIIFTAFKLNILEKINKLTSY